MADFFLGKYRDTYRPLKIEGEGIIDVLNYFSEKVPLDAPIAFIINYGVLNPYNIEFHFSLRRSPVYRTAPTYRVYGPPRNFYKGMYHLTIRIDDDSSYHRSLSSYDDSLERWNDFIDRNLSYLRLIDSRHFLKLGLTAQIYIIK